MISGGILNIDKAQNMTSHDVVSAVRRITGIKRVGHTGTLDPMASGVLPVCIGKSTRIMEYLDLDLKTYRCTMILGIDTNTQDIWGTEISRRAVDVSEDDVRRIFSAFSGLITQTPPMYSALKVNGKKLYEYAREGKTVEVKSRQIYIHKMIIEDVDLSGEEKKVTFIVECSKGTYVRTICRDAGEALGCGAALCALERIQSGIFSVGDAIKLEDLQKTSREQLQSMLIPSWAPLIHFGKIIIEPAAAVRFVSGQHISFAQCRAVREPEFAEKDFYIPAREEYRRAYNVFCSLQEREIFLGVAFLDERGKKLIPDKVFSCAANLIR